MTYTPKAVPALELEAQRTWKNTFYYRTHDAGITLPDFPKAWTGVRPVWHMWHAPQPLHLTSYEDYCLRVITIAREKPVGQQALRAVAMVPFDLDELMRVLSLAGQERVRMIMNDMTYCEQLCLRSETIDSDVLPPLSMQDALNVADLHDRLCPCRCLDIDGYTHWIKTYPTKNPCVGYIQGLGASSTLW